MEADSSYIGKTYRHSKVRVSEHQGVSPRTGKPVKGTLSTFVWDHMLVCDNKVVLEDFRFLGSVSTRYLAIGIKREFVHQKRYHLIRTYTRRSYYCFEYSV